MNCEEARVLLDAYIDSELSQEEMRALMDHVESCEECAREMEAALLLKDTLAHMDDDVQVPLQAQAAWRGAIRAEARKKNAKKRMRMAYAAAAALVLMIGGTFALRETPDAQPQAMMLAAGAPAEANNLIARDGMQEAAAYTPGGDYSVWKKISSVDPAGDQEALRMLAAEYNAGYVQQGTDICRIELQQQYLNDFLNASSRIGTEISLEMMCDDTMSEYVIVVQFCKE